MLRTIIQTTDPQTGADLPIPAELLEKVRRAATAVEAALHRLGKKFDIDARWQFARRSRGGFTVSLNLGTPTGGHTEHSFPEGALDTDDDIRRTLWSPLWQLGDILSEELGRDLERIRHGLQSLVAEGGSNRARKIARPADRGIDHKSSRAGSRTRTTSGVNRL